LNFKELHYIITVADYGNISKAAEHLFVAQPSLSRCIHRIENELGSPLFKRTSEGLKLTFAGERFIEKAHEILKLYKSIETEFSLINDMKAGHLVIGTATHLGSYVLPTVLSAFKRQFPNIEISIVEGVSTDIEEDLLKGKIDVAILHTPVLNQGLTQIVIIEEKFMLAVPPDDPVNKYAVKSTADSQSYLDLHLLRDYPFILTHSSQRTRQVSDRILHSAGFTPRVAFITKSIQTASRFVKNNLGVSLIPQSYCEFFRSEFAPNYYLIDERHNPTWQLIVAHSEAIPISRSVEEFIKIAKSSLPKLYEF
jgi:DNA-binding transcriptional LysR family regulator